MSDAWFELPTGRKLPDAPDRPAAQFGILRPATDELVGVLRRHGVRLIPEDELERHEGGRYWTDVARGEELELVRGFVDPVSPEDAGCIAFAIRDGLVVPFKRRGDRGLVTSVSLGEVQGGVATGKERMR